MAPTIAHPDRQRPRDVPLPPAVPGWPLLGQALALKRDPVAFFVRAYQAYGPVFRITAPGRRYTVLAGPEANLFLARVGEEYFSSRPIFQRVMRELRTENFIAALEGPAHQQQRKILKPALSREAIDQYIPRMIAATEQVARRWQPAERVNVKTTMQLLVVEQLGLAMANRAVGQRFRDAVVFAETLVGAGAAGTWHPLRLRLPGYRRSKARIVALMQDVIADHRAQGPEAQRAPDLIDALLAATDAQGRPLSEVDLIVGAQLPYIAGMDTAAATCAALLYALLKQPVLLERVTAEVDAAFAHGLPSAQTFRQMPLLHAAMLETLRRYPVVPAAPRYVTHPFIFAGHWVEAGQTVLISTTTSHFLPQLFPRPYQFEVARYSDPRNEHRQPGAWGPFAAGPHTCPCAGLTEVLVMTTLATLLHTVRLRLDPPDYTLRTAIDPLPGPEHRFRVRVIEQRARTMRPAARGPAGTGSGERRIAITQGATVTGAPDLRDPLLGALPSLEPDLHDRIARQMTRRSYPAGTTIIAQGAPADRFYIIVQGTATVYHRHPGGTEAVVRPLGRGDYFGEIGLLHGIPRTATVRATRDVEVLALEREDFLSMVAASDLVSAEIAALMQQRLAELHW